MSADIADLRAKLDKIEKRDKEYTEQVARLRTVLDQATKLLTRNSADVGAKAAKAEQDIAVLQGRIRSCEVSPISGSPALRCELVDSSGGVTLLFYGRRAIPGIEPGATVRVEGRVGDYRGHLAMANPIYRLLPRDGAVPAT